MTVWKAGLRYGPVCEEETLFLWRALPPASAVPAGRWGPALARVCRGRSLRRLRDDTRMEQPTIEE